MSVGMKHLGLFHYCTDMEDVMVRKGRKRTAGTLRPYASDTDSSVSVPSPSEANRLLREDAASRAAEYRSEQRDDSDLPLDQEGG